MTKVKVGDVEMRGAHADYDNDGDLIENNVNSGDGCCSEGGCCECCCYDPESCCYQCCHDGFGSCFTGKCLSTCGNSGCWTITKIILAGIFQLLASLLATTYYLNMK